MQSVVGELQTCVCSAEHLASCSLASRIYLTCCFELRQCGVAMRFCIVLGERRQRSLLLLLMLSVLGNLRSHMHVPAVLGAASRWARGPNTASEIVRAQSRLFKRTK